MRVLRFVVVVCLAFGGILASLAQDESMATISVGENDELGSFLVGADGMTLYIFTRDPLGESVCVDGCAESWPPLIVESEDDLTVEDGIPGVFGTVERADGTLNVTYNGLPLYYFARDEAAGDTNGQARGNVWWVVAPGDVYLHHNDELGHILVGTEGMTLYIFLNDEMGVSNCTEGCLDNWPPLLVEADEVVGDPRLPGELGTIERDDDTIQVTYNGWPLYYFTPDEAPGDIAGEGRGDVWYTVSPETLIVQESDELGAYLVDAASGMTVYLFDNDEMGVSNCTEGCLENWPAVTLYAGDRLVAGEGIEGELGTITREDDESTQITYNGMPLYFFANDEAPGDTNGQARGDVWWVVEP